MDPNYILRLHGDNRVILNLRYQPQQGEVDLEGCGAFFQIGETKPVPGEIVGPTVMFDFKPDLRQGLDGQGFNAYIKHLETGETVKLLGGTLRTGSQ